MVVVVVVEVVEMVMFNRNIYIETVCVCTYKPLLLFNWDVDEDAVLGVEHCDDPARHCGKRGTPGKENRTRVGLKIEPISAWLCLDTEKQGWFLGC